VDADARPARARLGRKARVDGLDEGAEPRVADDVGGDAREAGLGVAAQQRRSGRGADLDAAIRARPQLELGGGAVAAARAARGALARQARERPLERGPKAGERGGVERLRRQRRRRGLGRGRAGLGARVERVEARRGLGGGAPGRRGGLAGAR
jgi:hypothetical protein